MEYINALLGGLGLFLVGMWLMTDGLKLAAGDALISILHNWTKTPGRGLITGFSITALVQSSSAITVATIGFANAGLINLQQAVWVIFGSNVGTTMTGWIVALIGFKINLEAYALPLIGIGMIVRMTGGKGRRTAIGQAILGFGLFFLGISVLKESFMGLGETVQLPSVNEGGISVVMIYLLMGLILTTLMQSSSAAVVVILSAAQGGLVPLGAAAATVIGANLGTTTTALISVWGATPTAKRVAASHILFNLITASIALLLMSPMLWLVDWIQSFLSMSPSIATTLALFHTVFNLLGVIVMLPLAKRLIDFLQTRFISKAEVEGKSKYLDKNILTIPAVASDALFKELIDINEFSIKSSTSVLSQEGADMINLKNDNEIMIKRTSEVGNYVAMLSKQDLSDEIAQCLPDMMVVAQQYVLLMDLAIDVVELQKKVHVPVGESAIVEAMTKLRKLAVHTLEDTKITINDNKAIALSNTLDEMESVYEDFKLIVFKTGSKGRLGIVTIDAMVHQASLIKRMAKLSVKATGRMHKIAEGLKLTHEENNGSVKEEIIEQ
jgi:phosphate:Na+ symporter